MQKTVQDEYLAKAPTVDAILLEDIKLHHILISNEGVPEVKLQIGERYFTIYCDPVNVREVVHGRWISLAKFSDGSICVNCSVCGEEYTYKTGYAEYNYCPNCGAKMDGDGNV